MRRGLLLLAAWMASASAGAQQEPGYRRTVVPGRPLCLLWPGRDYVYHLDAAGSARTPGDTEFAAIEASFDTWRALSASCSDYHFIRGEDWTQPVAVGYDQEHPYDNYNIITFRERSCQDVAPADDPCWSDETCGNVYQCWQHGTATIALTTSTFSFRDGRVLDADIELNAAQSGGFLFTTVSAPPCEGAPRTDCVATDLQNTMTHEIGHVVGLDHVPLMGSTMEATAPQGETSKRIIDAGSATGFCTIYPRGLPPTQCITSAEAGLKQEADGRGTGCAASGAGPVLAAGVLLAGTLVRRGRWGQAAGRGKASGAAPGGGRG